jgi:hypothetical protein
MLHWWVLVHTPGPMVFCIIRFGLQRGQQLLTATTTTTERSIFYLPANYCQPPKKILQTCDWQHNFNTTTRRSGIESAKASDLVPCNKGTKLEFRALAVFIEDVSSESLRNKKQMKSQKAKINENATHPKTITRIHKSTTIITRVKLCYCICYEIYLPTLYFPWLVHKNPSCIETEIYTLHFVLYFRVFIYTRT